MTKYNVAVVGATGNVGREMLSTIAEREFPVGEMHVIASRASLGREVSFGETKILKAQDLEKFDFNGVDIAFFSPGAAVSAKYAPKAAKAGCLVIDNTSHFRMEKDIPLIVPEVNPEAMKDYKKRNIIANPNCSTIQLVVALKPLHDVAGIKRVVVSTYQSVSGGGKAAMDELYNQTKKVFVSGEEEPKVFTKKIAFNVIPHIDVFMDDGSTKEEWKMIEETKKIIDDSIEMVATCVRVPVFIGHSEAVNIEFNNAISEEKALEVLLKAPGVLVVDRREDGGYISPVECVSDDAVFISRLRKDPTVKHGLTMWVVSDNIRKGAALNAIQIAEKLISDYGF